MVHVTALWGTDPLFQWPSPMAPWPWSTAQEPAKTLSSMSTLCSTSPAPHISNSTPNLHLGSTILLPHSSSVHIPSISPPTPSHNLNLDQPALHSWVLSLEESIPDLIVDRGKGRPHRYHLARATMDDVCTVVTAQQTFIQQAAALIMEGKPWFTVDPKDTLIPILQGTSSLPQLYVAWKVLISRMRLGVKTWDEYIAEYQLQVGATALSPLSHC